jgi:ABC-2 type transport system ATP-binding protein
LGRLPPVLEIEGLTKRYGQTRVLDGATLQVESGEIFALLGNNGAGKTTLIGCVCGMVTPTAGTIRLFGTDLAHDPVAPRRWVGLVPQELGTDPHMTPRQSLEIALALYGQAPDPHRIDELLRAMGLAEKADVMSLHLSGGMRRRAFIAKALVHRPKLLFLDEPTAGVDFELRRGFWDYVRGLKEQGTTVVLTTHYLEEAEQLADRIGIIDKGRVRLVEEKKTLMRRLGERRLDVRFSAPVAALPDELGTLSADGLTLTYIERAGGGSGPQILKELHQRGLPVADLSLERPTLENVLMRVLSGEGAAAPASPTASAPSPAASRVRHPLNWRGIGGVMTKETNRLIRTPVSGLLGPLVSFVLYLVVFGQAVGAGRLIQAVPYGLFVIPGLIFLTTTQNAFAVSSDTILLHRMFRQLPDLLVTPMGPWELLLGLIGCGMVRGLSLGAMAYGFWLLLGNPLPSQPLLALFFFVSAAYLFGGLGVIAGLWAQRFEQINIIVTVLILPFTFLGGVFYSPSMLPEPLRTISSVNPVVHIVAGLRQGVVGVPSENLTLSIALMIAAMVFTTLIVYRLLRQGYNLRT